MAISDPNKQYAMALKIVENDGTVGDVERMVKNEKKLPKRDKKYIAACRDIEDSFQRFFGTKVKLNAGPRSGKIIIQYSTNDELERILELVRKDIQLNLDIVLIIITVISIITSIISLYYTFQTKKRYEKVALKLGGGMDFSELLKDYISKVDDLNEKDNKIVEYCNTLNKKNMQCINKIGLIRYNSYEDTKNKLSFTLALLNYENSGIVLNSIYTKDGGSNIYSKEIIKGTSKLNLSKEEEDAINKAINYKL